MNPLPGFLRQSKSAPAATGAVTGTNLHRKTTRFRISLQVGLLRAKVLLGEAARIARGFL